MADILHELSIAAPRERVYDAFATREGLMGWWTQDVEVESRVGSIARFGFNKRAVVFDMKIEILDPPSEVRWSCIGGPPEWIGTHIVARFTAAPNGGTVIHFCHGGWAKTDDDYPRCNTTWGHLMHFFRAYAESGKPDPFF